MENLKNTIDYTVKPDQFACYYPDEIARCLCNIIDNQNIYANLEEIIYDIRQYANNEYNRDGFRVLYNVLQELTLKEG